MPHHDIGVEEFLLALGRAIPVPAEAPEANETTEGPDEGPAETVDAHRMVVRSLA
jgi:hypothetical protein